MPLIQPEIMDRKSDPVAGLVKYSGRGKNRRKKTDHVMKKIQLVVLDWRVPYKNQYNWPWPTLAAGSTAKILTINSGASMTRLRLPACYIACAEETTFLEKVVCVLIKWNDNARNIALASFKDPKKAEVMLVERLPGSETMWIPKVVPERYLNTTITFELLAELRPMIDLNLPLALLADYDTWKTMKLDKNGFVLFAEDEESKGADYEEKRPWSAIRDTGLHNKGKLGAHYKHVSILLKAMKNARRTSEIPAFPSPFTFKGAPAQTKKDVLLYALLEEDLHTVGTLIREQYPNIGISVN